jgi:hypothetical protein
VLAGDKSPTLRWLEKIAGALDVDAAELVIRRPGEGDGRPAGASTIAAPPEPFVAPGRRNAFPTE